MIGRLYTWRGQTWRVLLRWGPPARDMLTAVCDECGSILMLGGHDPIPFCRCSGDPFEMLPSRRVLNTAPRNVLLERVVPRAIPIATARSQWVGTGERVVRPFRGLRRWRP